MNRLALALGFGLLLGLGLPPAAARAAAAPAAAAAEELEPGQLRIGDKVVPVVQYRGLTYRLVEPDGLADAALAGQLVCLEGKLREARAKDLSFHGTEVKLTLAKAGVLKGLEPGDNLWVGGKVERAGNESSLAVQVAVKMRGDLELFGERLAPLSRAGDWERMLDLAAWINRSKSYNPKISFEEDRQYRACRDRAIAAARAAAEAAFKDADANGYSRLAARLAELGVDREAVWRYFRQAAAIDPEQPLAAAKLAEAGFVRFRGQWVTREDKARLEAAEEARALRIREERLAREKRRLEESVSGAALYARNCFEMESALAALPPAEAAARLASELERTNSARLGRRAVKLTAALPVRQQAAPLAAAMKSAEPDIRFAALELCAVRGDLAARKLLHAAAGADASDEVVELACRLLAAAGDADALGALVALTAAPQDFRARAAVEALRALGQDRYTPAEWRLWWARNKGAFPAGPGE